MPKKLASSKDEGTENIVAENIQMDDLQLDELQQEQPEEVSVEQIELNSDEPTGDVIPDEIIIAEMPPEEIIEPIEEPASEQPAASRPSNFVHTVDGGRSDLTVFAKRRNDLIDLSESLKGRRIMTSKLHGIENAEGRMNTSYAVLYHGLFKVIIPADEIVDVEGDDVNYGAIITKRLGAEIDFIVMGIDELNNMAVASRKEAMAIKRRMYYFGEDPISRGDLAEARVVSVIRYGIFVELFGVEAFIHFEELSFQRRVDTVELFKPGMKVLVKVMEIDAEDRENIKLSLSVKQASDDTMLQALERYNVGDRYIGTVTMITPSGIFVSLDDGLISCHCRFPARGRPHIDSQVTVKIFGKDEENRQIWGGIVHW